MVSNDTWRGIGDVSIVAVAVLFKMVFSPVRGHLETGMMHDLHPLAGMPNYWLKTKSGYVERYNTFDKV